MEVRKPQDDAEQELLLRLLARCFHLPVEGWRRWAGHVGPENLRVAVQRGQAVGGLGFYPMAQWFGGRAVPCSGLAGVGIAQEARGTGASQRLLRAVLEEGRERFPISALYPATRTVYRKAGYELAGLRLTCRLSLDRLQVYSEDLELRQVEADAAVPLLEPLHRERARADSGLLERTPGLWARLLRQEPFPAEVYVGDGAYAILEARHVGTPASFDLTVRDMAWRDARAARRLLNLLQGHRSLVRHVEWQSGPADPLLLLAREGDPDIVRRLEWMLRIVDVRGALEARGYAPDLEAELHLEVRDDVLPWNAGRWTLRVAGGRGTVEPGGPGDLRLDVRGLASLFSGHLLPPALAAAGLADGDSRAMARAALLFAGPAPWMPDMF